MNHKYWAGAVLSVSFLAMGCGSDAQESTAGDEPIAQWVTDDGQSVEVYENADGSLERHTTKANGEVSVSNLETTELSSILAAPTLQKRQACEPPECEIAFR